MITKEIITKKFTSITYRRFLQIMDGDIILKKDILSFQLSNLPFDKLEILAREYKNKYYYDKDNKFFEDLLGLEKYLEASVLIDELIRTKFDLYQSNHRFILSPNVHCRWIDKSLIGFDFADDVCDTNYIPLYPKQRNSKYTPAFMVSRSIMSNRCYSTDVLKIYFSEVRDKFKNIVVCNKSQLEKRIFHYIKTEDINNKIFSFADCNFGMFRDCVYDIERKILIPECNIKYIKPYKREYYNILYKKGKNNKLYKQVVKLLTGINNIGAYLDNGFIDFNGLDLNESIKKALLISANGFINSDIIEDPRMESPEIEYVFNNHINFVENESFTKVYTVFNTLFRIANNNINDVETLFILLTKLNNVFSFGGPIFSYFSIIYNYVKVYDTIPDFVIESALHATTLNLNDTGIPIITNGIDNGRYTIDNNEGPYNKAYEILKLSAKNHLTDIFKEKYNRVPIIVDTIASLLQYKCLLCHNDIDIYDMAKNYVDTFNINSVKAIARFNSVQLLDISTVYDLSHLNFKVLLYLHYYNIYSVQYPGILESSILEYLVKNGNKLSDDNLEEICKNIDTLLDKECNNMKQIKKIILEKKALLEKEKYEEKYEGFDFSENTCIIKDNPISLDKYRMYILKPDDLRLFTIGISTECCYHYGRAAEDSLLYSVYMPNSGALVIEDNKKQIKAQAWIWLTEDEKTLVLDNIEFANDQDIDDYIDIIREYVINSPYENIHMGMGYNRINTDKILYKSAYDKSDFVEIPAKFDGVDFEKIFEDDIDEIYTDYEKHNFVILKKEGNCLIKKKRKK